MCLHGMLKKSNMETRRSGQKCIKQSIIIPQCGMLLNEENKEEYCQDITEDYDFLRADHYDSIKVHQLVLLESFYHLTLRPRLHGIGRIWDRSEIRPFSPVYTRIRPVRGSQIRPVPWFSCVYTVETDEFQPGSKFVRFDRVNGV